MIKLPTYTGQSEWTLFIKFKAYQVSYSSSYFINHTSSNLKLILLDDIYSPHKLLNWIQSYPWSTYFDIDIINNKYFWKRKNQKNFEIVMSYFDQSFTQFFRWRETKSFPAVLWRLILGRSGSDHQSVKSFFLI